MDDENKPAMTETDDCGAHFVDEYYGADPIILQSAVPVLDDDTLETLAACVLTAEHETYPRAVAPFAEGRLNAAGERGLLVP